MSILGLIATRGARNAAPVAGAANTTLDNGQSMSSASIAYDGSGVYVRLDRFGFFRSTTGLPGSWLKVTSGGSRVVFCGGKFVAWGGSPTTIHHSVDGSAWTAVTPVGIGAATAFSQIYHDGSKWIGVASPNLGASAGVWTSTDLTTWTNVSSQGFDSIAHKAGVYVAASRFGRLYKSTDNLVTWSELLWPAISGNAGNVFIANNTFLATGGDGGATGSYLYSSSDGTTWTLAAAASVGHALFYAGDAAHNGTGYLFAIGDTTGALWYTTDLATWTDVSPWAAAKMPYTGGQINLLYNESYTQPQNSMTVAGSTFLIAASNGDVAQGSGTSSGGWSFDFLDRPYGHYAITSAGKAAGCEAIALSGAAVAITAVAKGTSICCGLHGLILDRTASGIDADSTGTVRTSGVTDDLFGIAYSGSRYVAVGAGGVIITSTDGITWSTVTTIGTTLNSIAYSTTLGLWVAVGDGGVIYTSATGNSGWTSRTSGTSDKLRAVRAIGHATYKLLAVGDNSRICYSADGTTWSTAQMNGVAGANLYSAEYGLGVFAIGAQGYVYRCATPNGTYQPNTLGGFFSDAVTDLTYNGSNKIYWCATRRAYGYIS